MSSAKLIVYCCIALLESYEPVRLVFLFTNALSCSPTPFTERPMAPSIFSMISLLNEFLDSPGHCCTVGETWVVQVLGAAGKFCHTCRIRMGCVLGRLVNASRKQFCYSVCPPPTPPPLPRSHPNVFSISLWR